MIEQAKTNKPRKPKQQFVYYFGSRWSGFGSGVECINKRDILSGPFPSLTPTTNNLGEPDFPVMSGRPVLQFKGGAAKFHVDFDITGGIWILSPPARKYFERIDPDAFKVMDCGTVNLDGTSAPHRSLAIMTREIDALDVEKSQSVSNIYDPTGFKVRLPGDDKDYFRASSVRDFHFFKDIRSSPVLVSQHVKDEFKLQGWRGASFGKAYLI